MVDRREYPIMSDAVDYLHAYAARAICKARRMPFGKSKRLQRAVGRIYLLLTKEAAVAANVNHLDDFRTAPQVEKSIASHSETSPARSRRRRQPDAARRDGLFGSQSLSL